MKKTAKRLSTLLMSLLLVGVVNNDSRGAVSSVGGGVSKESRVSHGQAHRDASITGHRVDQRNDRSGYYEGNYGRQPAKQGGYYGETYKSVGKTGGGFINPSAVGGSKGGGSMKPSAVSGDSGGGSINSSAVSGGGGTKEVRIAPESPVATPPAPTVTPTPAPAPAPAPTKGDTGTVEKGF